MLVKVHLYSYYKHTGKNLKVQFSCFIDICVKFVKEIAKNKGRLCDYLSMQHT